MGLSVPLQVGKEDKQVQVVGPENNFPLLRGDQDLGLTLCYSAQLCPVGRRPPSVFT